MTTKAVVNALPWIAVSPSVWNHVAAIKSKFGLLLGPVSALLIWSVPLGLEPAQHKALAITTFMLIYWVAEPIEHGLTALIGLYVFWALQVTSFSVAFSGFGNSTIWFIFSSLLMAEAATRTGLATRLGLAVMSRVGSSPLQLTFGLVMLSFLLALFVPSGMGRVAILVPLTAGIMTAFGSDQNNKFIRGRFLVLTSMASVADTVILSGAASMMTRAILEEHGGIQLLWSQWFIACLPLSAALILSSTAVIQWMYPAHGGMVPVGSKYLTKCLSELGPWSAGEKRALLWFLLALGLWATDFFHRTNPAVIGIGTGLLLSLPKVGVLDSKSVKQSNFLIIIFSAGAIGMGNVLADAKLLPLLTDWLIGWMRPLCTDALSYTLTLYFGGFVYHFIFANRQSMLITSLPILLNFGAANGYDLVAMALLWTIGGGGGLFVYQSGVYVLGYSYGYFTAKDFFKFGVVMTAIQGVLLVALVRFYWPAIGLNWLH